MEEKKILKDEILDMISGGMAGYYADYDDEYDDSFCPYCGGLIDWYYVGDGNYVEYCTVCKHTIRGYDPYYDDPYYDDEYYW